MAELTPLSSRKAEVLHLIVREYIETGAPVASRTIARHRRGDGRDGEADGSEGVHVTPTRKSERGTRNSR